MALLRFSATISIIGINPYVRPPDNVLEAVFQQAGKRTSPIPIKGSINGAPFTQSLVRYQGDWRLYINLVMAKAGKLIASNNIREIVGQKVTLEIAFNPHPKVHKMIPALEEALAANPIAQKNWDQLIPSRQKEILRYLSALKSEEAQQRNLEKILHVLTGNEARFMARSWKDGK